tara:strand:- start:198 stop:308 length:111 start_codon:yes stop_codon:yes gene_type:complete
MLLRAAGKIQHEKICSWRQLQKFSTVNFKNPPASSS